MRGSYLIAALAIVAALGTGCGGGGQAKAGARERPLNRKKPAAAPAELPPEVRVTVEGQENPSDLGIVVAEKRGFFKALGLNVWVGAPFRPDRPVEYVSDGTDELGVAQLPQVAIARESGVPIVAVGTLVSQPTTAMIWLKRSKIRGLAGLKGRTIAIPGLPYQRRLLAGLLARVGLTLHDVNLKTVGYQLVPTLMSGKADAIFGGAWNLEGVQLKRWGAKPVVTRMRSFGAPAYGELVVIARKALAAEHPRLVHDFLAAVARGTSVALKHPRAATKMIEEADETNRTIGLKVTAAEVKATLPVLSRTERLNLGKANQMLGWMRELGALHRQLPAPQLLSNAYLAKRR